MVSDDIVTRLREDFISNGQCDYCEQWEWRGHLPYCIYQSAADEIERLREQIQRMREAHADACVAFEETRALLRVAETEREYWQGKAANP